ncbi:low molecular weight protein-tyrosine-phosphatase [Fulvivirga lutea]|uniref:protein-tyrosine-phosphatase n=1 Tax=Fulvivirga lutea TaxID=2810512 RepID=A0A974WGL2_9BACT|nr:low molecular weight protein-tyrosine-phosphatase [Fulvivirga lutea]QSE97680.1 low molecular weight phosphotyrosine protein phosphatase [Fulvivirga lutea]
MEKVLFVCLGNICRSPLAEGLAIKLSKELGVEKKVEFDSCGTSNYHIGEKPDKRTIENAEENGLKLNHKARQFDKADFREFDYIIAMDQANLSNIKKLDQEGQFDDKLYLMREFDNEDKGADVPDPYFGGPKGFQEVYDILERSVQKFLEEKIA